MPFDHLRDAQAFDDLGADSQDGHSEVDIVYNRAPFSIIR
jgi:hypothetical protein